MWILFFFAKRKPQILESKWKPDFTNTPHNPPRENYGWHLVYIHWSFSVSAHVHVCSLYILNRATLLRVLFYAFLLSPGNVPFCVAGIHSYLSLLPVQVQRAPLNNFYGCSNIVSFQTNVFLFFRNYFIYLFLAASGLGWGMQGLSLQYVGSGCSIWAPLWGLSSPARGQICVCWIVRLIFFLMNLFILNGTKMSIFNDERYNSRRRQISQTIIHLHNKETKIHEAKIRSKVNS